MAKVEGFELTVLDNAIRCGVCESRIEKVLGRMPGVLRVRADHRTQVVSLTLDTGSARLDEVKLALEAAGYRTVSWLSSTAAPGGA